MSVAERLCIVLDAISRRPSEILAIESRAMLFIVFSNLYVAIEPIVADSSSTEYARPMKLS